MRKMIFLDLDGTFWHHEQVLDSAARAVKQAIANGHMVFVNTGRTRSQAYPRLTEYGFSGYCFGLGTDISLNEQSLHESFLSLEQVDLILSQLNQYEIAYFLEGQNALYTNARADEMIRKTGFRSMPHRLLTQQADLSKIQKLYIHNPHLLDLSAMLDVLSQDLAIIDYGKERYELYQPAYSKGTAIHMLKQYINPPYDIVAVGDSENDLDMFRLADRAIVMGNAPDQVKAYADYVAPNIHEDGLWVAFREEGLI